MSRWRICHHEKFPASVLSLHDYNYIEWDFIIPSSSIIWYNTPILKAEIALKLKGRPISRPYGRAMRACRSSLTDCVIAKPYTIGMTSIIITSPAPGQPYDHPGASEATLNTLSPDKMAAISQKIFSNAFLWNKNFSISNSFFFRV